MRKANLRRRDGNALVAGLDEVGMGCLAGPVTAAVAIFPRNATRIEGVTDSKKLTHKKRMELVPLIFEQATFVGIGWAPPKVVNDYGLSEAWRRACLDALEGAPEVELLQVDGNKEVKGYRGYQETYVKGDALKWRIGAASIVAKVLRDLEMCDLGEFYPGYGWESNAGYGTLVHNNALCRLGPTSYHRDKYLRNLYDNNVGTQGFNEEKWEAWKTVWRSFD